MAWARFALPTLLSFATSIGLALLARLESQPSDILDRIPAQSAPAGGSAVPAPPVLDGAPTSAQDVLQGLGGAISTPQPPPESGAAAPVEPQAPAVPVESTLATPGPAAQALVS